MGQARHPRTPAGFDPFALAYLRDPQAALQQAVREVPVFYHAPLKAFVVLRAHDADHRLAARHAVGLMGAGRVTLVTDAIAGVREAAGQ